MEKAWCLAYGCVICFFDWLVDKIDNSDFFAGVIFAVDLMAMAWVIGILNILMGG